MLRTLSFFAIAIAAAAQIAAPRVGYIVDVLGGLRPVSGLAGAFVVAPPVDTGVISAAYSGTVLVVKKQRELLVDGEPFEAPAGPAEVQFSTKGALKEVFFPDASVLWTWRDGKLHESYAKTPDWSIVAIHEDEVSISGVPVRLPSRVQRVSQLGDNWFVVYAESGTYAVRDAKISELPEGDE